ncbi:NAD(P)-dependent oxidoreductase [Nocardia callitridis]|uniref:NAD(P)-dependent oxidoreductase n=1 Tax=Nocardia callitridis TaxID=648753 RepID=A0ABP9KND1_9NOCA
MSTLAFVGLGAIGLPMASVLAASGHTVIGVDPMPAARERAADAGITAVDSIRAVAATADGAEVATVLVMVATGDQLDTLVTEAGAAVRGQTWIVMSTVGPESVTAAARRLTAAGATVLDAPVTGGVARAKTGDLVLFAAGSAADLAHNDALLRTLGTPRTVGDTVGAGQSIKVINQHLCSVHIVAAAEALDLARRLGLDPEGVLDLVQDGAAGSWMLSDRGPRMLLGTDAPVTSAISIFVKDSGLVAEVAAEAAASVPLLDVARGKYLDAVERGLAARDDSRVIETYR